MFEQCSLLLLNCARSECMSHILEENAALPWMDILVMDSSHLADEHHLQKWPSDARIRWIAMNELRGQYARACGSMLTKSPVICTQDDDYLVSKIGWETLFSEWDNEHIIRLQPSWDQDQRSVKLGYGAMYDTRWLQASWAVYMSMQPNVGEEKSKDAMDEAWTTFWGHDKAIDGTQEHLTFLLDRKWMRADASDVAMSKMPGVLFNRERVRRCAKSLRDSYCSSLCQTESEYHTSLLKLVKGCFG